MHSTTLDVVAKEKSRYCLWPKLRGLLGARQRRHHGDSTPEGDTWAHPVLAMPSAPRARTIDNVGVDGEGGKSSSKGPERVLKAGLLEENSNRGGQGLDSALCECISLMLSLIHI